MNDGRSRRSRERETTTAFPEELPHAGERADGVVALRRGLSRRELAASSRAWAELLEDRRSRLEPISGQASSTTQPRPNADKSVDAPTSPAGSNDQRRLQESSWEMLERAPRAAS